MYRLVKLANGRVLVYKDGLIVASYNGGERVFIHPQQPNVMLISVASTEQNVNDAFALGYDNIDLPGSEPPLVSANIEDLIQELSGAFFFRGDKLVEFEDEDTLFYSDKDIEIRWESGNKQPQFRLVNNWGEVCTSSHVIRGGGILAREEGGTGITHNSATPSAWQYFTAGGTYDNQFSMTGAGGHSVSNVCQSAGVIGIPAIQVELFRGVTSIYGSVKRFK